MIKESKSQVLVFSLMQQYMQQECMKMKWVSPFFIQKGTVFSFFPLVVYMLDHNHNAPHRYQQKIPWATSTYFRSETPWNSGKLMIKSKWYWFCNYQSCKAIQSSSHHIIIISQLIHVHQKTTKLHCRLLVCRLQCYICNH